jgi:hypothetical protein
MLTVLALSLHLPIGWTIAILGIWTITHAIVAARPNHGARIRCTFPEIALALGLAVLCLFLYVEGSPLNGTEDRIHVAIIRRLMHVTAPSIGNIYFAPDVVYTYPFPGTHYLLALIGRVGDIDPIFLYQKLRAFWALAAAIVLYGCARAMFQSARIAVATTFLAVALVANGTFAAVPGLFWGQMAPFSHASDVAMGVLLPALLLLTFEFLHSSESSERWFFFITTLVLVFTMTAVHTREIVQFLVYLGAFAMALLIGRGSKPIATRTLLLIITTFGVLAAYGIWHRWAVPSVTTLVDAHREDLQDLFRGSTWVGLLGPPLPVLRNYVTAWDTMFQGWNPLVLLASPIVFFVLRRRPLVWFACASIACYLLIIRFPLLGIPYVYLTYYEILYTPVRNVIFFVHILTGATLYLIAARLAQRGYFSCITLAFVGSAIIAFAFRRVGPVMIERQDLLFLVVLAAYALTLFLIRNRRDRGASDDWIEPDRGRWVGAFVCLAVPLVVMTWIPERSPLAVSWRETRWTPSTTLSGVECTGPNSFCPPPPALIRLANADVSATSVFAIDDEERYPSALFMPQQMVVWPGSMDGFVDADDLFGKYLRHYRRAQAAYNTQPLYNDRESRDERVAFLRDLRVTHVLVNPRTHDLMSAVLSRDPDLFRSRYDDGKWALYEVLR